EARHAVFERARFEAEQLGGAGMPTHSPAGAFEHRTNVLAFDVLQPRAPSGARGFGPRELDDETRSGRDDNRALDGVSQVANVARPRVSLQRQHLFLRDRLDPLTERS